MVVFLCGNVQVINHFSCPRCLTQEFQAGFYRWVIFETADIDTIAQLIPAKVFDQAVHDKLKRFAVQRVIGLLVIHTMAVLLNNWIDTP